MSAKIILFAELDAKGVDKLIDRARLTRENKIIARNYLKGEKIVDIAALREVNLDRSTVGKRIKKDIVPELERVANL